MANINNIIIIGTSHLAKVIIDIIEEGNNYNIIGFINPIPSKENFFFQYKILGSLVDIPEILNELEYNEVIIAIENNYLRKEIHKDIEAIFPRLNFIKVIHPNATIGKNVVIGQGTIILENAIINSEAIINEFCVLQPKSSLGHNSVMKKYSSLARNATIGGFTEIGTCSSIDQSASVIQNLTIGKNSVVEASSLVLHNIKKNSTVCGIPAKVNVPKKLF